MYLKTLDLKSKDERDRRFRHLENSATVLVRREHVKMREGEGDENWVGSLLDLLVLPCLWARVRVEEKVDDVYGVGGLGVVLLLLLENGNFFFLLLIWKWAVNVLVGCWDWVFGIEKIKWITGVGIMA
ncbi:hypothetical protein H5410_001029 [Solanum commersonii]|uniref:Transmembrane protein n=1 Tax=Solanum commersonii TaxID=4109 RepID=A0A9J6AXV7_SOLCO|nr:hypothetical protein H5410_001029 [Solanum commersonii]